MFFIMPEQRQHLRLISSFSSDLCCHNIYFLFIYLFMYNKKNMKKYYIALRIIILVFRIFGNKDERSECKRSPWITLLIYSGKLIRAETAARVAPCDNVAKFMDESIFVMNSGRPGCLAESWKRPGTGTKAHQLPRKERPISCYCPLNLTESYRVNNWFHHVSI